MGGIVGRLFREFAVTLSVAILVSMVISLTATPMMCAHLLKQQQTHGRLYRASERFFNWLVDTYGRTLNTVLRLCRSHADDPAGHHRADGLFVHRSTQRVFPRTGQRPHQRVDPGRSGHVVSGAGQDPAANDRTSSRRIRAVADALRLHRRRQYRAHVHFPEAAGRKKGNGPADHRAPASQARRSAGRHHVFCRPRRTSASAAGKAAPSISSPCRAIIWRT